MESPDEESRALHAMTTGMQQGSNAAWQQFHESCGPRLFRHLLAVTRGDAHLAAEALQHAYLRIGRHVRPCAEPLMWRSWTRRVATSALTDLQRREGRLAAFLRRWREEPLELAEEGVTVDDDGMLSRIEESLTRIDPAARALLEAKYLRAETVETIAARLGLSVKATESRLTRARSALREQFVTDQRDHAEAR
ncbi:MAG TPA: RNA polymerase sigma factor [Opitutaceae bacterium]|nr:RNA polymerase sigma factor [Opitutaceae bacterium]